MTAVDISVDQGRMWKAANLTGKATEFGWRFWEFPWTPQARVTTPFSLEPAMQARVSVLDFESVKRYVSSFVLTIRALATRGPVVLVFEE